MNNPLMYQINIEQDRCQGHSRCCSIAPNFFESDDFGNVRLKGDGTISPDFETIVRLAVANCPERALSLTNLSEQQVKT